MELCGCIYYKLRSKESQLAVFLISSEGMSRGRLTLAALQCMDSKELNSFLFVQHPQIGNAYVTEGKMTLKYKSKSEFLGKKRLRLIRLSLLTNPLLSSDMCFVHVSLLSMVTPNSLELEDHFMRCWSGQNKDFWEMLFCCSWNIRLVFPC